MNSTAGGFVIPNILLREEDHIYSCEPNNIIGKGATKQLKITVQGEYPSLCRALLKRHTPNANMADHSDGPGLVAWKRG